MSGTWLVGHTHTQTHRHTHTHTETHTYTDTHTQTHTHTHTHTHTLISRVLGPWELVLVEKSDVILYYLT